MHSGVTRHPEIGGLQGGHTIFLAPVVVYHMFFSMPQFPYWGGAPDKYGGHVPPLSPLVTPLFMQLEGHPFFTYLPPYYYTSIYFKEISCNDVIDLVIGQYTFE